MALAWIVAPLRRLSIRHKLTLIVLVTSGVAVILASATFLAYDYLVFRERLVTDLDTTAEGVGLLAYPALAADLAVGRIGEPEREVFVQIVGSLQAHAAIEESVIRWVTRPAVTAARVAAFFCSPVATAITVGQRRNESRLIESVRASSSASAGVPSARMK